MRYSKLFVSLVVVLFVTMFSIRAEANTGVINQFETFYGDTMENLYPDSTNACDILCHVANSGRMDKNWYGDCVEYFADIVYGGIPKASDRHALAITDCDALDSDSDGWTTNTEVLASHGLGRPTLPGNNFAEAQSLAPDATSASTTPTLQAVFYDVNYGQVTPYSNALLEDQPARVEWEIDVAGYGFAAPVASSGPINIYNPVYSVGNPADNTFTWAPGVLMDSVVYSWRVRFMDGNRDGVTHEWGNWAYASFSTTGCTFPGAAVKVSPPDGATNQNSAGVTLTWSTAIDASSYDVYLSTIAADVINKNPAALLGNTTGTSLSTGALLESATYYWRVIAKNACGDTDDIGTWSFTTSCMIPAEATKVSPPDAAVGQDPAGIALTWNPAVSASSYDVYLGANLADVTNKNGVAFLENTIATSSFTGPLSELTTYYWRVIAKNACGDTDDSTQGVWSFTTDSMATCTDGDSDTYAVEGGSCGMIDCDDTDPAVNPGAAEVCGDGIDNNCDTQIDEGCPTCTDADGDGYYAEAGCGTEVDCDDSNPGINPGACDIKRNGIDEDCDGSDRHSGPACSTGDPEICDDGIDNDGDGYIDCLDADCSGDPACGGGCVPSAEVCDDGIDNDCDGKVDCADKKDCKNFPGC